MRALLRVYVAGPLFSDSERRRNRELRDALSPFAETFLPQEDGSLLTELIKHGHEPEKAKKVVFRTDLSALRACDALVIVMDGRTIDEGACFELGVAYALGKPCVGIKTDTRTLLPSGDNPMIECALQRVFADDASVVKWIAAQQAALLE